MSQSEQDKKRRVTVPCAGKGALRHATFDFGFNPDWLKTRHVCLDWFKKRYGVTNRWTQNPVATKQTHVTSDKPTLFPGSRPYCVVA